MKLLLTIIILSISFSFSKMKNFSGRLLNADGNPLKLATVKVYGKIGSDTPKLLVHPDKTGYFSFQLNENEIQWLEFSGVDHQPLQEYILPSIYKVDIKFEVLLKQIFPAKYKDEIIFVLKNKNSGFQTLNMKRNESGLYELKYNNKFDTLKYQVYNHIDEDRATNGNFADSYEYDGNGDYNSLLINKKGDITISYNPNNYKLNWDTPSYKILTETNKNKEKLDNTINIVSKLYESLSDLEDESKVNGLTKKAILEIKNEYLAADNPLVKKLIGSVYLYQSIDKTTRNLVSYSDKKLFKSIVDGYKFDDPIWNMDNLRLISGLVLKNSGEDLLKSPKVQKLYDLYKGSEVAEYILINQLEEAETQNNETLLKKYYNEFITDYPSSRFIEVIKREYNPNVKIKIGRQIPDFVITDLDGKKISSLGLKGKYILIDFWATWCGPCMKEMPNLHDAYAKFKGDNFEILSLSFDRNAGEIKKTINNSKYKMPWKHAFVAGGFKSELAKQFEVDGIPKPILVSPTGEIIALSSGLRGPNLEFTLKKFLKD
ncbi:TlpA disulfide reductase family protein [Candidatus Kapabacteria bacterium]|nr:TlpA disulfide reductase family protein [Candidatus Kapabacteria bacterium]